MKPSVTIKHTARGVIASVSVHNAGYLVRRATEVEARAALQLLVIGLAVVGEA